MRQSADERSAVPPGEHPRRPGAEPEVRPEVVAELVGAVGGARAARLERRLATAARAYDRERYQDALRAVRALESSVPDVASVQELHMLVSYRLGRWRDAIRHGERARALTGGGSDQIPVLMDSHRALGHHRRVEALWDELRVESPAPDVLVEGRLVMAADLADRRRLPEAIALLTSAGSARNLRHPAERHLRQWYLLADLHERAGDLPRARQLFRRVADADPELADAHERMRALGHDDRHGGARSARRR